MEHLLFDMDVPDATIEPDLHPKADHLLHEIIKIIKQDTID